MLSQMMESVAVDKLKKRENNVGRTRGTLHQLLNYGLGISLQCHNTRGGAITRYQGAWVLGIVHAPWYCGNSITKGMLQNIDY
jgi:hypothetical protein